MRGSVRSTLAVLLLFLAAWLPRVLALDVFVTVDERKWLARSANFYQAITHGDLAATFQREHPGVTVMWAGTLGFLTEYPQYAAEAPGQMGWDLEHLEAWLEATGGPDALEMLAAGRWWVALGVALAVAAGYFPLRRLLGEGPAFLGTLFVAWSPFYVAMSRQLHPDGLSASLIFLALLLLLAWLYGAQERRYLLASGVMMGLAWLSKTPAIFLVPIGAVLIGLRIWELRGEPEGKLSLRAAVWGHVLWGVVAAALFVGLWPAMWLDPVGTLQKMALEMGVYVERHTNVNYFWGQPTDDPGPLFYPVAWFFRTTPLTVVGLAAAAWAAWRRQRPLERRDERGFALALVVFALLFAVGMSLGAKKFDRYILPSFLALDVVAFMGWLAAARAAQRWWATRRQNRSAPGGWTAGGLGVGSLGVLGGVALAHGLLGFVHYPYYLTYYNPLAGGTATAPHVLFAGWGEGLDAAAEWLNEREGAELRVASWYYDGPFSYFFDGQATGIGSNSPLAWLDTDYAVLYVNQWQRQLPSPESIAYFAARSPDHVVRFRGLELARVYDMSAAPLPGFLEIRKSSAADFGGRIRLAAHEIARLQAEPGDRIPVTFYLQSLAPMERNYNVLVRLVGEDGAELWREEGWPWGAETSNWPVREIRPDGHEIHVPEEAAAGSYQVLLSFYDPETLEPLRVDGSGADAQVAALLQVGQAEALPTAGTAWQFGNVIALEGVELPDTAQPGEGLALRLQWASLEPTATDYTVFVHVVGPDGERVAQKDQQPMGGFAPTHAWAAGQKVLDGVTVELPAELAPGEYEVRIGLYAGETRLPVSRDGAPVGDSAAAGVFRAP